MSVSFEFWKWKGVPEDIRGQFHGGQADVGETERTAEELTKQRQRVLPFSVRYKKNKKENESRKREREMDGWGEMRVATQTSVDAVDMLSTEYRPGIQSQKVGVKWRTAPLKYSYTTRALKLHPWRANMLFHWIATKKLRNNGTLIQSLIHSVTKIVTHFARTGHQIGCTHWNKLKWH